MLHRRGLVVWLVAVFILVDAAHCLRFYIKDRERLCFYMSARPVERLQGEATLENGKGNARLSLDIRSEDGKVLFERHDTKIGVFTVVTPPSAHSHVSPHDVDDYDPDDYQAYEAERKYKACLLLTVDPDPHLHGLVQRAVTFRLRPADRQDEDGSVKGKHVKGEKVDTIATALDIMLTQLNGMSQDLVALQSREHSLVEHNQSIARRLAQFTIISLVVLVATASFQFSHYKSFFTSKKLC